jgi:hypothetical protein
MNKGKLHAYGQSRRWLPTRTTLRFALAARWLSKVYDLETDVAPLTPSLVAAAPCGPLYHSSSGPNGGLNSTGEVMLLPLPYRAA